MWCEPLSNNLAHQVFNYFNVCKGSTQGDFLLSRCFHIGVLAFQWHFWCIVFHATQGLRLGLLTTFSASFLILKVHFGNVLCPFILFVVEIFAWVEDLADVTLAIEDTEEDEEDEEHEVMEV